MRRPQTKEAEMNATKKLAALAALLLALATAPAALAASGHARPDDRAGVRGPAATASSVAVRPDDRAGVRGPVAPAASAPAVGSVTAHGFDWGSAGIGAAAGAGAILALLGAFVLTRATLAEAPTT
jgi:hypothetical protein